MQLQQLIKSFSSDLWPQFREFVQSHFHPQYILQDQAFFNWQYRSPFNHYDSEAMKVLVHKGKILGFLGLIPLSLHVSGETKKGCALCNLMVDESCRAFGAGSYFIKSAMGDFEILWGTGYSPKTGPMYEKLGWKLMGDLNRYLKVFRKDKVSHLLGEPVQKNDKVDTEDFHYCVKKVEMFDGQLEDFMRLTKDKYPITVCRSGKYLNWRYAYHPYFTYHILTFAPNQQVQGYLVYRVAESTGHELTYRIGHILDLMGTDEAIKPLVISAEQAMSEDQVDLIDYYSTGRFHHRDFLQLGYHLDEEVPYNDIPMYFNPISRKRGKINFLIYCPPDLPSRQLLLSPDQWYLTKGDGDKDRPNPH